MTGADGDRRYVKGHEDGSREWRERANSAEHDLAAVIDMLIIRRSPMNGGGYRVETPASMPEDAETYDEAIAMIRRAAGLESEGGK